MTVGRSKMGCGVGLYSCIRVHTPEKQFISTEINCTEHEYEPP